MNFWRQDVTKSYTIKPDFLNTDSVMVPIPEELLEILHWDIDTKLYMRYRDGEIIVSKTDYSDENVNENIEAYYNEIGNAGC